MSFQLTNFTKRYEEAVSSIKIIKQSNQRVQEKTSLDFRQQQLNVEAARRKVQNWITDIQKSYLDPQTARRVQIVKQQLSTQYQKHKRLIQQLSKPAKKISNRDTQQQIPQSEDEQGFKQLMFDHDNESKIMKERNQQLSKAHKKILNIHNVSEQTKKLAYQQGQIIDIIDENMGKVVHNVNQSNKQLDQAATEQKKGQQKYMCLFVAALIAILVVIIILVVTV